MIDDFEKEAREGSIREDAMLSSTSPAMVRRLLRNQIFQRFVNMPDELDDQILSEAGSIYASPSPEGFSHPRDLELCAYVVLSAYRSPQRARNLLTAIDKQARPEFFCSTELARYLLSHLAPANLEGYEGRGHLDRGRPQLAA